MPVMHTETPGSRSTQIPENGLQRFGALVLLWSEPQQSFVKEVTALAVGIADQLAIALGKARLSAISRVIGKITHPL